MPVFCKRSPDGATLNWGSRHPVAAYCSLIDPGWMKGWVGLVDWQTVDPHKWSAVSYRSSAGQEKDGRSQTDVLPLCHVTIHSIVRPSFGLLLCYRWWANTPTYRTVKRRLAMKPTVTVTARMTVGRYLQMWTIFSRPLTTLKVTLCIGSRQNDVKHYDWPYLCVLLLAQLGTWVPGERSPMGRWHRLTPVSTVDACRLVSDWLFRGPGFALLVTALSMSPLSHLAWSTSYSYLHCNSQQLQRTYIWRLTF